MPKLTPLKSSLSTLSIGVRKAPTPSDMRISGRALTNRRLKMWTDSPCCAICGCLTDYPHGFELDHKIRLDQGGPDTEANCQILCVWYEVDGSKQGCHADKTRAEVKGL